MAHTGALPGKLIAHNSWVRGGSAWARSDRSASQPESCERECWMQRASHHNGCTSICKYIGAHRCNQRCTRARLDYASRPAPASQWSHQFWSQPNRVPKQSKSLVLRTPILIGSIQATADKLTAVACTRKSMGTPRRHAGYHYGDLQYRHCAPEF